MNKLLTIIIPSYNMEKYLSRGLDSLLIEKGRERLDVIVVNDGSKDQTSAIAHEYAGKYPEMIRVIDKSNGNYGSCINAGLKVAEGKYIRILDADDTFETKALERFLDELEKIDADLVFSGLDHVNEAGQYVKAREYVSLPPLKICRFEDIPEDSWRISMACMTYKTENLRQINYHQTEGVSYSDEDWTFSPVNTAESVCLIKEPVYRYLIGREGQTIAVETRRKRVSHVVKVTENMIMAYNHLVPRSDSVKKYLDYRLYSLIEFIYRTYLLSGGNVDFSALSSFDKFLCHNRKDAYQYADTICLSTRLPYKFVSRWRKTGKEVPSLVLAVNRLFNYIHQMKNK